MSYVDFFLKKAHDVSLIVFLMSLGSMSHVGSKKGPCRLVGFKGQRPPESGPT